MENTTNILLCAHGALDPPLASTSQQDVHPRELLVVWSLRYRIDGNTWEDDSAPVLVSNGMHPIQALCRETSRRYSLVLAHNELLCHLYTEIQNDEQYKGLLRPSGYVLQACNNTFNTRLNFASGTLALKSSKVGKVLRVSFRIC